MSGNGAQKLDRRVRRTREALGGALIALMQQMPFDDITVQQVLDRAGVGRSTFYEHFEDKHDLFLTEADRFFGHMAAMLAGSEGERVAPVRELFSHVADVRKFYMAMIESGTIHDVLEIGQRHFARGIERRLVELPRATGVPAAQRAAAAHALAGSLLALMSWWVERGSPAPAEEMDVLFHRLAWQGVASA